MDLSIIPLLARAFISMTVDRIWDFIIVLSVLFLLTIPLGYLIIKYFRLFKEKNIFWYDHLSLSLGIGTGVIILLSFFTMFIRFNVFLICSEIILIDAILLYLCYKNKLVFNNKAGNEGKNVSNENQKNLRVVSIFVLIFLFLMFCYYSIMPLTTDMAIFRDYDLLALGIQENSALKLPFYGIDIYYPPGMSILTAFLNEVIPNVNIHKIMLNLSYFFMFYLFILFYQLGNVGFKNKFLGFFFMVAFAISAPPRNFVTGGATPPSTTSAIFCIIFLIFILRWLEDHSNKNVYAAGVLLAAGALTHIDTLLIFLWGFLALLIIYSLFDLRNYRKYLLLFIKIGVLSLLIVSPFLMNSYEGKKKMESMWSGDAWENYAKGEIHPKPLSEIIFFSGKWVFYLSLLSVLYPIYMIFVHKKIDKSESGKIALFILLWAFFLFSTNNYAFLRIARPILLFYALNIIMWFGTAIVFSLGAGFGFYILYLILLRISKSRMMMGIFLTVIMLVAFARIFDYEFSNKEGVFHRHGGFIRSSFANANNLYNSGDIYMMEWLKDNNIQTVIIQGGFLGYALPSVTKIKPSSIFVNNFYDDPDRISEMWSRESLANKVYQDEINDTSFFDNFSYILLQSSYGPPSYSKSLLESGRYDIIERKDGAKILRPNIENFKSPKKEKDLIHIEVEDLMVSKAINRYSAGWIISMATVGLPSKSGVRINLSSINQNKNMYNLYIRHLTFVVPLAFKVKIADKIFNIEKTTDQMMFSESKLSLKKEDLLKSNFSIEISSLKEFNLLGEKYYPEIDWVELEAMDDNGED